MGEEYEELLAAAGEPVPWPDDRDEHDLAGHLLHGRDDRLAQGRDAHARQPHRQRLRVHGLLAVHARRRAGSSSPRSSTPPGRSARSRPSGRAASTSCSARSTPGRFLDLVEREAITATLIVPAMMQALAAEQSRAPRDVSSLRWLSHGSAPAATELLRRLARDVPGRGPPAHLRRDGDVADRDAHARRTGSPRRPARVVVRAGRGRRRGADRRRDRPASRARPARSARCRCAARTSPPGYWNKPARDGGGAARRLVRRPATSATSTRTASSSSSTARRT